ncbi:hypothetical protein EDD18DRAFT_1309518 [Armillaria luteobubalina]|uniref:PARP catalytic domain-containing protein n=1 Tax=Armillaria luteobubalina TaxID=153913 RepID=A0AA39TNZ8_9AGAR|nr:hypothetical protein EDD18DRAFT_1309518 [Armillaria luteobubalina]
MPPNDICLVCRRRPKRTDYQFCSNRCTGIAMRKAPQLMRVLKEHVFYKNIKMMFAKNWHDKEKNLATIVKIYLITWTASQHSSFEKYRERVAKLRKIPKGKAKEIKSFHSERRASAVDCLAICSAFKSSLDYKRKMVHANTTSGIHFGGGVYMVPASNKAFQYAVNLSKGSNYLTTLVTRTVLGNMQLLMAEQHHRLAPNKGYDSVKAHTQNDPWEYVTYNKDAVRPAYLVVVNKPK